MDVYLVPVGQDRYELYCEEADEPTEADDEQSGGIFRRMRARFREMLAEAERERLGRTGRRETGWAARVKARTMRWVVESIAQQRLLWQLRRHTDACLYYPDDIDREHSLAIMRSLLRKEFEKHRFWLIIDTIGFIVSGVFMLIPGPNLIAYYFAFRLVGHALSLRGARKGLAGMEWRTEGSAPLSELRRAIHLAPEQRVHRVRDVALRLRLEHLATFFERTVFIGS